MPSDIWHKFDAVSWSIIEYMFAHIGVLTFLDNMRTRTHSTQCEPNRVYICMVQGTISPNKHPVKHYYIYDMDLRKYYRLMYLYYIAHHSEKSEILEDIYKRLYPEGEEGASGV